MNGYIKYFDNGGKNMTFVTDNEKVYDKYNEIWEVIRKLLKVKFTVNPVRDDKYLVTKLKIFNRINRTTFNNYFVSHKYWYVQMGKVSCSFAQTVYFQQLYS